MKTVEIIHLENNQIFRKMIKSFESIILTPSDIIIGNVHELISIRSRVFVEETERVHQLVGDDSLYKD